MAPDSGDVEDGPGGGVVLELRDAVDHEIVGEGLETGYRGGIAADILRPGYAASGVTATSLEITRRWRLSRGRSNRFPIHHAAAIQDRAHDAPRRIDASWAPVR